MRFLYTCLLVLVCCAGCKKSNPDNSDLVNVGAFLQGGSWVIAQFSNGGQDEAGNFSGYTFSFAPSGTLTAANGAQTVTGSWGSTVEGERSEVVILFNGAPTFEALNHDWDVFEAGTRRIRLQHVSASGTDMLVLERQ